MYARFNLNLQNRFESKHAQALWELCVDYLGHRRGYGETPYIRLEQFRKLMGIEEGTYALFKLLSQWVLKPAIAEINRVSDFHVEIEYQREGRKVTALKFKIRRVRALPAADSGQHELFLDLADMPLAVKLLHDAGLALQEAFAIWQKGFAFVDAGKRPAGAADGHSDEAFTRYVREKIHLLHTRRKQGKANNLTGFADGAEVGYGHADFEREEAAKDAAEKRRELKKLKDGMEALKRGEADAVEALTRQVIDTTPALLDEALEEARRSTTRRCAFAIRRRHVRTSRNTPRFAVSWPHAWRRGFPGSTRRRAHRSCGSAWTRRSVSGN